MSKSVYKYMAEAWKRPRKGKLKEIYKKRLQEYRRSNSIVKLEHPTRLDRARELGYKAIQGVWVARSRVRRGSLRKHSIVKGRRAKRKGETKITMHKSIQRVAEERAAKKFPNAEVLNSYWVGDDGKYKYYEVILVDPFHPAVLANKSLKWIHERQHKGRVFRGKTSAGKRGRGLRHRGKGAEKVRPSIKAHHRKGK